MEEKGRGNALLAACAQGGKEAIISSVGENPSFCLLAPPLTRGGEKRGGRPAPTFQRGKFHGRIVWEKRMERFIIFGFRKEISSPSLFSSSPEGWRLMLMEKGKKKKDARRGVRKGGGLPTSDCRKNCLMRIIPLGGEKRKGTLPCTLHQGRRRRARGELAWQSSPGNPASFPS